MRTKQEILDDIGITYGDFKKDVFEKYCDEFAISGDKETYEAVLIAAKFSKLGDEEQ